MSEPAPPRLSLAALFLTFLRFGALAFGGPIAQIAMIRRELVEEQAWLSSARFNRLLAVMQALPGPEAHELCVHLGMLARGRIGGLLAGLGFMLPGFVLMLAGAWAYGRLALGQADWAGFLLGVQIAVVAVIARGVERIGRHALTDWKLWLAAGIGFALSLSGAPSWIPTLPGVGPSPDLGLMAEPGTLALFVAGLKGGLLTFGGAYTAIPYVRADTVGRGWLSDGAFLDGVALAGMLPAPMVIFATFVGYVVGGWSGALAVTAGMFLPAFAFSLIFFERLEAVVDHPALHRLLAGVTAVVVGAIGATCLQLAWSVAARAPSAWGLVLIAGAAVAAVWLVKGRWTVPVVLAAGGLAGALLITPV